MGFDPELFLTSVDEELKCPICYRVLEEPLQGYRCDHIYCAACIDGWLLNSHICPMDRLPLERSQLQPVSKMVTNLLHRLEVKCPYEKYGCCLTLPLGSLSLHESNCRFRCESSSNSVHNVAINVNPLSMIRELAITTTDLSRFKQSVASVEQRLLSDKRLDEEMSDMIEDYGMKFEECHKLINQICDPLFSLILGADYTETCESDAQLITHIDVNIQNLSEFTNEGLLFEYLRQNDIFPENIQRNKTLFARSLNFVVTVRNNERCKILDSNLWPVGVTAFIRGEKMATVCGTRSKNEPASVTIKPGITCWSGSDYFN